MHGLDRLTRIVRDWAADHPDDPIIYGVQASYQLLPEPLTRHLLDRVLPDRPLGVHAFDGHTVWANTVALERAGLLHGRALPPGNEIVMGADGLATGELREPAAYAPLMALLPSGGREKFGITTGRDPVPAAHPGRARRRPRHHPPRPGMVRPPRHHLDPQHGRQPLPAGPAARSSTTPASSAAGSACRST